MWKSRTGSPKPICDGRWFYSLFNLLWLEGYYPETFYDRQCREENVEVTHKLAQRQAESYADENNLAEVTEKIYRYLLTQADEEGKIREYSELWYGWVLWDVRVKSDRFMQ